MKKASLTHIFSISLTLFTLCVIGAVTWFFYLQERAVLLRELKRHGRSLAENLAYNSEYSLLFLDADNLKKLADGVVQNRDVRFAMIVNIQGTVVAENALQQFPQSHQKVLERVSEILNTSPAIYFTEDYEAGYHIFAPVFMPGEDQDGVVGIRPGIAEQRELLGIVVVGISFERLTELVQEIQKQVFGLALFIVILAIIVSRFLVKTISQPIEKLAEGTRRIARGDLTCEVKLSTPAEIGVLALSFNQMMHDLRSSRQELEGWTQTLENKVQERTQEIEEKNRRLTELVETMKRMQEQLVHSEKMASLGQLVAGIAHEINNPVNFIASNITPLKQYINDIKTLITRYDQCCDSDGEKQKELEGLKAEIDFDFLIADLDDLIQDVGTGASRIRRIVQDLRNFSRLDEAELKTIDIHQSLDTTLNLLGHIYENRIMVHKKYEATPHVECYAGQLNQVFMNLLANAAQAITRRGNVWIMTQNAAHKVKISIRDDGRGIPEEVLPKIFDPFFTTKDVGEGTGLGLSISYGIIEKHQGEISVKSHVDEGTEFTITISQKLSDR